MLSAYYGLAGVLALALFAFGATNERRDLVFLVALFVMSTSTFCLGYGIGDGFLSFLDFFSSTAITLIASLCAFFVVLQRRTPATAGSVAAASDTAPKAPSPAEQALIDSRINEIALWKTFIEQQRQRPQ